MLGVARKRRARRAIARLPRIRRRRLGLRFGRQSAKAWLAGALGLFLVQRFNPLLAGTVYKPAVDKVITGIGLQALGLDNSDLTTAGIKEGLSTLLNDFTGGMGPMFGGAARAGDIL